MTAKNPPVGEFINWQTAYVGEPPSSNKLGKRLVNTFNHLRRYRAQEYIASYSGRYDPAVNGDWESRFHIITRFPVRKSGDDAQIVISMKKWEIGRPVAGPIDLLVDWRKAYGGAVTITLSECFVPVAAVADDGINDDPSGFYTEWMEGVDGAGDTQPLTVTPVAINTNDGFQCSRLDVDNIVVHRLNVMGCPHNPMLEDDESLVSLSDVATGQVLRGWDEGNNDGTIGALCHYMDGDSSDAVTGTDSMIHNSCRPLFNTPYALGVHLNNEAAYIPIRSDAADAAMTYKVKPRNLTGGATDIACDIAVVISGDAAAELKFISNTAVDSSKIIIPAGGYANPTLITTSHAQCEGTLNVDPDGDFIEIQALSGAGNDIYIHAVSLWEPYQYR